MTYFFVWFSELAKPLTRAISWVLLQPLTLVEALLFRGMPDWEAGPLPWTIVALSVVVFAHWQSGLRLALFCAAFMAYLALFDLWPDSMQTLALVLVTHSREFAERASYRVACRWVRGEPRTL